jgi:hypothetical protein
VEITTAMNTNQISKEQARHLHAALVPTLRYVNLLHERLNARSFRGMNASFKAQAAMDDLVMVLHYLTCDGVGEPGRPRRRKPSRTRSNDPRPILLTCDRSVGQ